MDGLLLVYIRSHVKLNKKDMMMMVVVVEKANGFKLSTLTV